MRVYLATEASALTTLRDGGSVTLPAVIAESDDEEDEFDALMQAAANGPVVVAEVGRADEPVSLSDVQALHVDADGSGDLAWYAPSEVDEVLRLAT